MKTLIIESGGTKASWGMIEGDVLLSSFETEGMHPLQKNVDLLQSIAREGYLLSFTSGMPDQVYFYGAGCGGAEGCSRIEAVLKMFFKEAVIEVTSDLVAAGRSLFGDNRGLVVLLGTGSHACLWDGEKVVKQALSMGIWLTDEGGGAQLGKLFLEMYYAEELSQELKEIFEASMDLDREKVLKALYGEVLPIGFFSSVTPFLSAHREFPEVEKLLEKAFYTFVQRRVKPLFKGRPPIGIVGSTGYYFRETFTRTLEWLLPGVAIETYQQKPFEKLVDYHKKQPSLN